MLPPSSSIFSSDPGGQAAARATALKRLGRTALWVVFFLALFEGGVGVLFTRTRLAHTSLRNYLWYGTSYEAKLRELVNTPDLPSNSVLYAGWLDPEALKRLPSNVDVTVYGMSFSMNLADALKELRPDLSMRLVGGPGSPLSHTYAIYRLDRTLRKTRVAIIGVTSAAVQEVLVMNRGSLFSDSPFPYFFPRFKLQGGEVVLAANSLINSSTELRLALNEDRGLWERQLAVLAANDDAYHRALFASDPLDGSALGRLVRRGLSKHHLKEYTGKIYGPSGFRRQHEACQLFRGLLRQMVRDLRAENVQPIVVLFSLQGYGNHLYSLVEDILREDAIPYVNSYDICPSEDRNNYRPDLHFVSRCNLAFGRRTLDIMAGGSGVP